MWLQYDTCSTSNPLFHPSSSSHNFTLESRKRRTGSMMKKHHKNPHLRKTSHPKMATLQGTDISPTWERKLISQTCWLGRDMWSFLGKYLLHFPHLILEVLEDLRIPIRMMTLSATTQMTQQLLGTTVIVCAQPLSHHECSNGLFRPSSVSRLQRCQESVKFTTEIYKE